MHFQTAHLNPELHNDVKIDDLSLEQKDSTKFLGVIIDKNLSWNQHLSSISSQTARGIGILYRIKNLLSKRTLLSLYNTLILPYINYCNIAWGNCSKTKLDNVLYYYKRKP